MQGLSSINICNILKITDINQILIFNNKLYQYSDFMMKKCLKSQPISRVLSCMIINLGFLSPKTSSSLPYSVSWLTKCYKFALLLVGFASTMLVTLHVVSSYLTFSPLLILNISGYFL